MSLKVLAGRMKRTEAPTIDTTEIDRARRAEAIARGQAEAARKEAEEARKAAAAAQAERDRHLLESAIGSAAAKHRALNPAHVVALTRDRFELRDGKVIAKDKPDADAEAYLGEWLAAEGKHFLPAQVPGGGAGAPSSAAAPKIAPPADLTTAEGMSAYARGRVASAPHMKH